MENLRTATQVLHSGYNPQDHNGTQAIPIYQKTQMMPQGSLIFPYLDIFILALTILQMIF